MGRGLRRVDGLVVCRTPRRTSRAMSAQRCVFPLALRVPGNPARRLGEGGEEGSLRCVLSLTRGVLGKSARLWSIGE